MNKIIQIDSLDGLLVETKFKASVQQTSADAKFEKMKSVFESGFTSIGKLCSSFYENVVKANPNISKVNLEFGLSLTGSGNLYVVETGVEASFKVTIDFEKKSVDAATTANSLSVQQGSNA